MVTLNQLLWKKKQIRSSKIKKRRSKSPGLHGNPYKKGICTKVTILKPKKPNSAKRKIAKLRLIDMRYSKRQLIAYIPGEGHNLQDHAAVLVRGGRVPDLPGVRYKLVRGKYDLLPLVTRRTSRSQYGVRREYLKLVEKDKL